MKYHIQLAILAGIMLLVAVPSGLWPYVYYQVLRWVVMAIALICARQAYTTNKITWVWIMGITAILFNPIAPFYFSKTLWSVVDIIAAIFMFSYVFTSKENE